MSEYTIEKGVPFDHVKRGPGYVYPWPQMEPGDSFVVPLNGRDSHSVRNSVTTSASYFILKHRPGLMCRTSVEGDGLRVWLIAKPNGNGHAGKESVRHDGGQNLGDVNHDD